jgi:DNA polymerase (family 10)
VNNKEIVKIFQDIADLLELKGENPFKIRAYQKAAFSIEHLPIEVEQLVLENRLGEIPGIGEAISKKINELVTTHKLHYYDELKSEFPKGIIALLNIPNVGPKTAMLLTSELDIETVDDLEAAIASGRVAMLPRMGNKTSENILRSIRMLRGRTNRIPIGQVLPVVNDIIKRLQNVPGLKNLMPAGSLRRFMETVGDIDLLGTADNAEVAMEAFIALPQVKQVMVAGTTKSSVVLTGDLQVDLRIVEHDAFGSLLQHFTGSKQHNIDLRERSQRQGLSLSEYGITVLKTGILEKYTNEESFYRRLGLQFIPPELREGSDEIQKAQQNILPKLVELSDIKGDLHIHTRWSDGRVSIEEMVNEARRMGYQYLAVTDHSVGRGISGGLNVERLKKQINEIKELNKKYSDIRILTGIEVDIRANGTLDYPDELLSELDIVCAAVHSGLNQNQTQMTRRILKVLENPNVDILAHPTCRQLSGREPVELDMEVIFRAALKTSTALEINAMPDRLDLADKHIYRARQLGVKLVINTDAHDTNQLGFMSYGVGISRRGWCQAEDLVNTRPLREMLNLLLAKGTNS